MPCLPLCTWQPILTLVCFKWQVSLVTCHKSFTVWHLDKVSVCQLSWQKHKLLRFMRLGYHVWCHVLDPCTFNRGGCEGNCTRDANLNVTCSCSGGLRLDDDGKSCTDVRRTECNNTQIYDAKTNACIGILLLRECGVPPWIYTVCIDIWWVSLNDVRC